MFCVRIHCVMLSGGTRICKDNTFHGFSSPISLAHPSEAHETVRMEPPQPPPPPPPVHPVGGEGVMVLGEGAQTCDRGHLCSHRPHTLPSSSRCAGAAPSSGALPIPAGAAVPAFSSYCSLFLSPFLCINSVISGTDSIFSPPDKNFISL